MIEAASQRSETEDASWLIALVEGMPQLIWRAAAAGSWTWSSTQWQTYTGQTAAESMGDGWLAVVHHADVEAAERAWASAAQNGLYEAEFRIADRSGGYRWFQTRGAPRRDDAGNIVEWVGTSTDVHKLRQLQSEQKVLVAELQHRTRNLIAVVHAISMQTVQRSSSLADFQNRFDDRLSALSRVQGLLSTSDHEPITIARLLTLELKALAEETFEDQVSITGPDTVVRNSTAQTLALAVHELCTNALKYGALSAPTGRLRVSWHEHWRDDQPWARLEWQERGAPPRRRGGVVRKGYGRQLIEQAMPRQLGAETHLAFEAEGVTCTIDLPLRHFIKDDLGE